MTNLAWKKCKNDFRTFCSRSLNDNFENLKRWIKEENHSKEISHLIDKKLVLNAFLNGLEIINNILKEKKIIKNSLEEINDIHLLKKIEKEFFEDQELFKLNERSNGLYEASFGFFIKFKNEVSE